MREKARHHHLRLLSDRRALDSDGHVECHDRHLVAAWAQGWAGQGSPAPEGDGQRWAADDANSTRDDRSERTTAAILRETGEHAGFA